MPWTKQSGSIMWYDSGFFLLPKENVYNVHTHKLYSGIQWSELWRVFFFLRFSFGQIIFHFSNFLSVFRLKSNLYVSVLLALLILRSLYYLWIQPQSEKTIAPGDLIWMCWGLDPMGMSDYMHHWWCSRCYIHCSSYRKYHFQLEL